MKKNIIISIASIIIIVSYLLILFFGKSDKLQLTQEEKEFIYNNKNTDFFMGYYVTPSEKIFINKLCAKLSDDTGLNIYPFEGNWNDNLKLLQSGKLPILANMNITEDRLYYTNFTEPLQDIPIGIYSRYDNRIASYENMKGKTIGRERKVSVIEDFKIKYPDIQFNEKYYNNLYELKKVLSDGEIDGFISSLSYSSDLRFYYFFNIESLSKNNNYIGVSKNYPMLYRILNKEVAHLIDTGWDENVRNMVNIDIEARLIELTHNEKKYIKENDVISIGIPQDYSYYSYGDKYFPKGIIPEIFNKIEFFTDLDFIYIYDSYENLLNREDIDIIVSSEKLPFISSFPIFSNDIIAVSNGKWDIIDEVYELESYAIGMANDPVSINDMKKIMPYIDISIYKTYDELYKDLEQRKIDYSILPERVFEMKYSSSELVNNGTIKQKFHYVYSKENEKLLISIINKCLSIINIDTLINEEVSKLIREEKPFNKVVLFLIVILAIIGTIIMQMIKRKNIRNRMLYYDEETLLHNKLWLKTKLKLNYPEYIYFLVQPKNINLLLERYGQNAYKKALKTMVNTLNENIQKDEYVVKLQTDQFIMIKKQMSEQDRIFYMHKLKTLFERKLTIFDINYSYEMNVVSLKTEDEKYNYEKLLKELDIGLRYAQYIGDAVDYTYDVYSKYQDKIDYDTQLSSAIINEEVYIKLNKIVDRKGQTYGYDVSCGCTIDEWGEITSANLKRNANRLGLENMLDKIILKELFDLISDASYKNTKIFIEVNKKTLLSNSFFEWIIEKLESLETIQLFIKIDIDTYEALFETFEHINHTQLGFVISDFDQNLVSNIGIKNYKIPLLEINARLFSDLDQNKEIIDFIISFSRKHNKSILVNAIKIINQYHAVKDHDIDYYVDDFGGDKDENIDSRG